MGFSRLFHSSTNQLFAPLHTHLHTHAGKCMKEDKIKPVVNIHIWVKFYLWERDPLAKAAVSESEQ